jgi:PAS domain S-box-containing protein
LSPDTPIPAIPFTVRLGTDGRLTFTTSSPGDLFEFTPDDIGRALTDRHLPFLPDEGEGLWEDIWKAAAELKTLRRELRVIGPRTGRVRWFRVEVTPGRDPDGATPWTGLAVDVTDLKVAERRLREAYRKLDFHMNNTPLAVIEWEDGTRIARWNGQAEAVFGWSAAEVAGKAAFDFRFVHEEDAEAVRRLVAEMMDRRSARTLSVNRNYTKAGAVIWCEWHNSSLIDEAGKVVSVLSLVLDVTERRAASDALARSEAGLRSALGSAKMLGWDWDLRAGRRAFSTDYAGFFGLPSGADYCLAENAWAAVHPDDRAAVVATWERALRTGADVRFDYRGSATEADGEYRWFSVRGQVLAGPDGQPARVIAVTTDVTDRKRVERERVALDRQLLDTQKWESLGVLAGGVAHDFNNILTVVLGSAGLARRLVSDAAPAAALLSQIETAARRAADLCRQLLAYAGRATVTVGRTDLNRTIRDSSVLLEVPATSGTRVVYDLDPSVPAAQADPGQMRQVLMNLVMNAAEALGEDGGEVCVRTAAAEVCSPDAGFVLAPAPGRYARLEVSDTGPGIAPEVRARMFDPFFTTRFAGRGLGLAAVLGIVRAHQGGIWVNTTPGRGTTMRVYWPAAGEPFESEPATEPPPDAEPSAVPVAAPVARRNTDPNRPVALIVDDEMYVREVAASTLEDLGYEPVLAGDGPGGLEQYRRNRDRVRVAILDVMMPGMTGDQVLAALREEDSRLPVVVISGFTDRRAVPDGVNGVEFLQKPFHPEELVAAIQRVVADTR